MLVDSFFGDKPHIKIEAPMFLFAGDDEKLGGMLESIRMKVKQEDIPLETEQALRNDFMSASAAHKCLEMLDTALSFLQATGGSFAQLTHLGDTLLEEYLQTVLLVKEKVFASQVVATTLRVRHIDALYKLLRKKLVSNPFEKVMAKFKKPLPAVHARKLEAATGRMDVDALLRALENLLTEQLTGGSLNDTGSLKACLDWIEVGECYLNDTQWFVDHFPAVIQLKSTMEVFNLLQKINT